MLKTEYEILSYIRENPNCQWLDVVNAFDPRSCCNVTNKLLLCLLENGLVETAPPGHNPPLCRVELPPQAVRALAKYEQQCKNAQEERQRRKEELVFNAKISLVSAAVGGAISLLSVLISG